MVWGVPVKLYFFLTGYVHNLKGGGGGPRTAGTPVLAMPLGRLSNKDGNDYENLTKKVNCAASNLMALIPSRLIRQMWANGFGVNF